MTNDKHLLGGGGAARLLFEIEDEGLQSRKRTEAEGAGCCKNPRDLTKRYLLKNQFVYLTNAQKKLPFSSNVSLYRFILGKNPPQKIIGLSYLRKALKKSLAKI